MPPSLGEHLKASTTHNDHVGTVVQTLIKFDEPIMDTHKMNT